MKHLRFRDISLLSRLEKKARRIEFHRKSNLIYGMNHTGKSALLKMLLETLGAYPSGKLEGWDDAVISCVTLDIDGRVYKVIRQASNRALFAGHELKSTTSRERTWSDVFGELTDFNLVLSDKQEKATGADPACFFLPFFINQNGSWGGKWDTFQHIARFKAPIKPILEFFGQIVPPEYYGAKARRDALQLEIAELDRERRLLERARSRICQSLPTVGPKISLAGFEKEIHRLTLEVSELNARQEVLRLSAVQQNECLAIVEQEICAVERALADYAKDEQFISHNDLADLTCPTCGSKHTNTFLSTLQYAEDARALEQTLLRLRVNREQLKREIDQSLSEREELQSKYERVTAVLETKRGELKFGEIVETLGAENAVSALEAERQTIEKSTTSLLAQSHEREVEMKSYVDRGRRKEILARFREHYARARQLLNLNIGDVSKMQIQSRPDISGSGGPRAVLAYYAALWQICSPTGQTSFVPPSIPLVVDCPNQQGQDAHNLPVIIAFLSSKLPQSSQVIVTFEKDVSEYFDKRIELVGERSLLIENEYAAVKSDLDPLFDRMQQDLLLNTV